MAKRQRLRSPVRWFGGKGPMARKLLKLLPPQGKFKTYVEPFGGGASLLFAMPPSNIEVYNDIDSDLVNFFSVVKDAAKFDRFYKMVALTPYSRREYFYSRDIWQTIDDDVMRAYRFFVVVRMGFSGTLIGGWSYTVGGSAGNMSGSVSRWVSTIEMLPRVHERLSNVIIENDTFENVIKHYDSSDTLFYCDPPYIHDTRGDTRYPNEMSNDDHERLVDVLLGVRGYVVLSGYANKIYKRLESNGWRRIDFATVCHAAGRTRASGIIGTGSAKSKAPRTESVWLNYGNDYQMSFSV